MNRDEIEAADRAHAAVELLRVAADQGFSVMQAALHLDSRVFVLGIAEIWASHAATALSTKTDDQATLLEAALSLEAGLPVALECEPLQWPCECGHTSGQHSSHHCGDCRECTKFRPVPKYSKRDGA